MEPDPSDRRPRPGRPVRGSATGRPIMALLDLLGRRWTLRVIWELGGAPTSTFRELQHRCGDISSSVLTARLAELADARVVERADRGYALTPDGEELLRSLLPLERWAEQWAERTAPP